jgi:hypothetical protein
MFGKKEMCASGRSIELAEPHSVVREVRPSSDSKIEQAPNQSLIARDKINIRNIRERGGRSRGQSCNTGGKRSRCRFAGSEVPFLK